MTINFTFDVLFAIAAAGGLVELIDGIMRVRGKAAVLSVIEIILAILFLLSLFVEGIPLGQLGLAIASLVILVVQLFIRGSARRGGVALTIVSLVLLAIWVVLSQGWLTIPGIS